MNQQYIAADDRSDALNWIDNEVRAGFRDYDNIITWATLELYTVVASRKNLKKALSESQLRRKIWTEVEDVVTTMTNDSIQRLKAEEEQWVVPTDSDRLDWVFEYLEKTGVAARQNYWCCQTCANAGIADEMKKSPAEKPYVGFVYYHEQALPNAMACEFFSVAFGANKEASKKAGSEYHSRREVYGKQMNCQPANDDRPPIDFYDVNVETYRDEQLRFIPVASPDLDARRVASRFMDAAILAGLNPIWNGSAHVKIKLKVKWARRRSTSYKFSPEGAPALSDNLYKPLGPDDDPDFYTSVELVD